MLYNCYAFYKMNININGFHGNCNLDFQGEKNPQDFGSLQIMKSMSLSCFFSFKVLGSGGDNKTLVINVELYL